MQMRQQSKDDLRLRFFIGDVRDKHRLYRAMNGVGIVVHAAALKQVSACEYNRIEAVRTNIDGAANVIDADIDNKVEKVIAISTDKAVHPVNLYGGTKLVAEKLFCARECVYRKATNQIWRHTVRQHSQSRGSVIPLFLEQREEGSLLSQMRG